MTEQNQRPEHDRTERPAGSDAGTAGGHVRRERLEPRQSTERNIGETNRIAEDSVVNNVTPDEATD